MMDEEYGWTDESSEPDEGWMCPTCLMIYAPTVKRCPVCVPTEKRKDKRVMLVEDY